MDEIKTVEITELAAAQMAKQVICAVSIWITETLNALKQANERIKELADHKEYGQLGNLLEIMVAGIVITLKGISAAVETQSTLLSEKLLRLHAEERAKAAEAVAGAHSVPHDQSHGALVPLADTLPTTAVVTLSKGEFAEGGGV